MKTNDSKSKQNISAVKPQTWYNRRLGAAGLFVFGALATYLLASRAEDTGSLQQYFLTLVLLVFSIDRLARAAKG